MTTALRTRPPTGRVPWPLILIEGAEKAGKSWACAELSASPKVGQTYWIDLGEGSADEYGAVPGARYLVVEHDGSFAQIITAVEAIKAEATRAAAANEPPIVVVLDSGTAEWDLLKGMADAKARERLAKKGRKLAPDAEPQISMDLWNDVNGKHRRLMTLLMTFPGIAVITARGKEVAALDAAGRPVEGSKEYKVDGQKNLAYDATVWIRVSRDHPPVVVGARSVHAGVRPGTDRPVPSPGLTLEKVVFDILRCNPGEAHVRDLVQPQTVDVDEPQPAADPRPAPTPPARTATVANQLFMAITDAETAVALKAAYERIDPALKAGEITLEQAQQLAAHVKTAKAEIEAKRVKYMFVLLGKADITDRNDRIAYYSDITGRTITSTNDLTPEDVENVIARVDAWIKQNTPPAADNEPAGVSA